jgi:hypothetical protein
MRRIVLILCLAHTGCHDETSAAEKRQKMSDYASTLVPKIKAAGDEVARIEERMKTLSEGRERQVESGKLRDATKRLEDLQAGFDAAQKKSRVPRTE